MKILNNKEFKELSSMRDEFKAIQTALEKKGYVERSDSVNKLFEQLRRYNMSLIDFGSYNRADFIKAYRTNAIVRGIVAMIANATSELANYVELVDVNEKLVGKHWAKNLIKKPNDLFTFRQYIKAWAVNRLLTGDAFQYVEKGVGRKLGEVSSMYVLNSQDVDILLGDKFQLIKGFKLKNTASLKENFLPDEIIFSREYNPTSLTFFGLSPLESAANMLQLLESGDKRQNTSLKEGGVNTLVTPKPDAVGNLTPEQAANFEEQANNGGGSKNMFWKSALEVHKIGDTTRDLQILETSKYAINALCFVYGISVDMFLGQAKYENAKEAKKGLYEQAAIPLFNEWLEDFNMKLLSKENLNFILNTDKIEVLRQNSTEMLNALGLMGATLNEKREFMGYPLLADDYANKPMIPLNTMFGDYSDDINEND